MRREQIYQTSDKMSRLQTCTRKICCFALLFFICALLLGYAFFIRDLPQTKQQKILPHNLQNFKVVHHSKGLELYIHTAILDSRFNHTVIRIYALQSKEGVKVNFNCRWSSYDKTVGSNVAHEVKTGFFWIDNSWPHWSPYFACEYNCAVPSNFDEHTITLASNDMKYQFHLPVEYIAVQEQRKKVAVCLKPQTNKMNASRLIEWFEMLQLVGISDVIVYDTDVIGIAKYVYEYYVDNGIATRVSFPYLLSTLHLLENPKMTSENRYALYQQIYLIGMHDCLHRFRGRYENLLFIDTDELIFPALPHESIPLIIERAEKVYPHAAGYMFFTAWHWEDMGEVKNASLSECYMQRYPKCTFPLDNQPKSIVKTDYVITLNFHEILDVSDSRMTSENLPWDSYAAIHHFRGKCADKFAPDICKTMLGKIQKEMIMHRVGKNIAGRVSKVLNIIL